MTMKFLLLVLSLVAVVFARPDVSHLSNLGYQYRPPATSYGVPIDNGQSGASHHHHHQHQHINVPSDSYGAPLDSLDNRYALAGLVNQGNIQYELPNLHSRIDFLGTTSGIANEGYNPHLIQDQKHVYYYAVPDEEQPARLRIHVTPSNKKNTNVIFVKAPSYAHAVPEIIYPPHQEVDKTKVYVLIKKPEQPAAISIPAPAPVKSQPEVYIVNYENQAEAERVLSGGRGGHPTGVNVHNLGSESSFITALGEDLRKNIAQNDKYSGFDGKLNFFVRSDVAADKSGSVLQSFSTRSGVGSDEENIRSSNVQVDGGSVGGSLGGAFIGGLLGGGSVGGSLRGASVDGSLGGASAGGSLGGASAGGSLGGASVGGLLEGASVGGSLRGASTGGSVGGASVGGLLGGASVGGSLREASVGGSLGDASVDVSLGGASVGGSLESAKVIVESDKSQSKVDLEDKGNIQVIIGDEKSYEVSNENHSDENKLVKVQGSNNVNEIRPTIGTEFQVPLLGSPEQVAAALNVRSGSEGGSFSGTVLGAIPSSTERSSVVEIKASGPPFTQYGPP